jgi:hypothetical protein
LLMTALYALFTHSPTGLRDHQLASRKVHAAPTFEVTPASRPHTSLRPAERPPIVVVSKRGDQ